MKGLVGASVPLLGVVGLVAGIVGEKVGTKRISLGGKDSSIDEVGR